MANRRAGPIHEFYETGDTPEGLIYRIGSAHSEFLRRDIERFRQGRPANESHLPRRTMGHYWWRFNGTWPLIETELVDYLLEPKMAYYAVARAQAPLLLSYEFGNHIYLWLTNDTGQEVSGTVVFQMLNMNSTEPVWQTQRRVTIGQSDSQIVLPLDNYGMFNRNLVLYARLLADDGTVLASTTDFAEFEANLTFPDAELELVQTAPNAFNVTAGRYARSVHLSADWEGSCGPLERFPAFAANGPMPYFSDNYFNLAPGQTQSVRVLGGGRAKKVTAKGWFCDAASSLSMQSAD